MRIFRKTPSASVQLRQSTAEDLFRLQERYWHCPFLPLPGFLTGPSENVWLMSIAGQEEPIALIEYFMRDDELTVLEHWVAPDHRGNGYGTLLLELVESIETPSKIHALAGPASEHFYAKVGFKPDRDMLVMTKIIRRK